MKKILFSSLILLIFVLLTGCPSCGYSWNCNNFEGMAKYYATEIKCEEEQLKIATQHMAYSRELHIHIINNCTTSNGEYKWKSSEPPKIGK